MRYASTLAAYPPADRGGVQELLAARSAHRTRVGLHDDVLEAEAREDAFIGVALGLVRGIQPRIVDVERVGVFHRELATPQQAGPRSGLVAVLVLDLVDRERQVFVAAVEVFHEQGKNFFVCGGQQVVGAAPVFQAKDAIAVLLPPPGGLIGLARQEGRKVHLLRARVRHLVTDDRLDAPPHLQPERQPREHARRLPTNVASAHEQPMARDLGISGVIAEGAKEELRKARSHRLRLLGATCRERRGRRDPRSGATIETGLRAMARGA